MGKWGFGTKGLTECGGSSTNTFDGLFQWKITKLHGPEADGIDEEEFSLVHLPSWMAVKMKCQCLNNIVRNFIPGSEYQYDQKGLSIFVVHDRREQITSAPVTGGTATE